MKLVFHKGKRLHSPEKLETITQRTNASVASLPPETKRLDNPISPTGEISPALIELTNKTRRK